MATLSNQGPTVAAWVWQYLICHSENTHTHSEGEGEQCCCAVYPCFCWLFSNTCAQQPRQQTQRISAQAAGIFLSYFFFFDHWKTWQVWRAWIWFVPHMHCHTSTNFALTLAKCLIHVFFISSPKVSCQDFDLADALGGDDDKPGQYNSQEVCIRESNQPFSVLKKRFIDSLLYVNTSDHVLS